MKETTLVFVMEKSYVATEELEELKNYITETYPKVEIDTISGNQEVYSYILSIE